MPTIWARTEMMRVLRRPSRMDMLNRNCRTAAKSANRELTISRMSSARRPSRTTAATHRPQWRRGTARIWSGGVGLPMGLPGPSVSGAGAAVDVRGLEGTRRNGPLVEDLIVDTVGDDRLEGQLHGVAELGVVLAEGDAVGSAPELLTGHLEVVASARRLGVVGGHGEVVQVGVAAPDLELLKGVGVL